MFITENEIELIIDTLENAIEWGDYAPDYFQKKHNLKRDKENVKKSTDILKRVKTINKIIKRT